MEDYLGIIRYEIRGTTIPTVTIESSIVKTVIAVEAGRNVSFLSYTDDNPDWITETGSMPGRITRESMRPSKAKKAHDENFSFGKLFSNWLSKNIDGMNSTEESHVMGEKPIFTYYTSTRGGAVMKINNHYPAGVILDFKAENGVMLIRQGGFLAGLETVNLDRYKIPSSADETEYFRSKQLGIRYMQRVSGGGVYFIEAQGDVEEYSLAAGDTISVEPMKLVAMTEGIQIVKFVSTGKTKVIRDNVGHDFDVVLQATEKAGKVYISSRIQKNHFDLEKEKDDDDDNEEDEDDEDE